MIFLISLPRSKTASIFVLNILILMVYLDLTDYSSTLCTVC